MDGDLYAQANGMSFTETSSYTRHNVEKAFYDLAFQIYQKVKSGQIVVDAEGSEGVKPGRNNANQYSSGGGNKGSTVQLTTEKSVDCGSMSCGKPDCCS